MSNISFIFIKHKPRNIATRVLDKNCFVIRTAESYENFKQISIDIKKSYMLSINPVQILDIIIKNKLL